MKGLVLEKRNKVHMSTLAIMIIFVIYHILIQTDLGDDIYFREIQKLMPMRDLIQMRYEQWTSRLIIEYAIYFFVMHPLFWKIINTLVCISIACMLRKLLEASKPVSWYSAFLILIYPFYDMVSAGWIATTLNCLWPLWCILFVSLLVKKRMDNQKIRWYEYIVGYAALLYGSNEEQAAAVLFAVLFFACVIKWRRREFVQPFLYVGILLNLLSLAFIFTCPGNDSRFVQESMSYAPHFSELSVFDKTCLGMLNVERVFIANADIVFTVVAILLAMLVYKRTKDYWKTLVSFVPVGIIVGYTALKTALPKMGLIFCMPKKEFILAWTDVKTYICLAMLLIVIISILLSVYWLAESMADFALLTGVLGVGFATAAVMGFSPTLYASADRVFIYFYFSLIIVSGHCLDKTLKNIEFTMLEKKLWITAAVLLALACVINNIPYCLEHA